MTWQHIVLAAGLGLLVLAATLIAGAALADRGRGPRRPLDDVAEREFGYGVVIGAAGTLMLAAAVAVLTGAFASL